MKPFPASFLLCLAAAGLFAGGLRASENLLENPGFESGAAHWGVFVPAESRDKGCEWTVTDSEGHTGRAAMKMCSLEPARFTVSNKTPLYVNAGDSYLVSAWVKLQPEDGQTISWPAAYIRIPMRKIDGSDAQVGHQHLTLESRIQSDVNPAPASLDLRPGKWTRVAATITIPPGVERIGVELFSHGFAGCVWWDEVSIAPAAAPKR
jgi:hypothetical protein